MKSSKMKSSRKAIKFMIRNRFATLTNKFKKFMSSKVFACFLTILIASIVSFILVFKCVPFSSIYKVGEVVRGNIKSFYPVASIKSNLFNKSIIIIVKAR